MIAVAARCTSYDCHGAQSAYVQGSLSGGLQSVESQTVLCVEG